MNRRNLLVFVAREPLPGFTKTRLGRTIGMERAAALYRAFLTDLADRFVPAALGRRIWEESATFDLCWAFTPDGCDFPAVLSSLGSSMVGVNGAIGFVAQEGDGLAARLNNLLRWGRRQGYERTVVAATDSPQLTVGMVGEAFAALADRDVAIGRVHDGGYYLIGLRGDHDVLSGTPIGAASAADGLVARAEALGLRVAETAPTFDVDEEADLTLLYEHLAEEPTRAPATWAALHTLGLIPVGAVSDWDRPIHSSAVVAGFSTLGTRRDERTLTHSHPRLLPESAG